MRSGVLYQASGDALDPKALRTPISHTTGEYINLSVDPKRQIPARLHMETLALIHNDRRCSPPRVADSCLLFSSASMVISG